MRSDEAISSSDLSYDFGDSSSSSLDIKSSSDLSSFTSGSSSSTHKVRDHDSHVRQMSSLLPCSYNVLRNLQSVTEKEIQ